MKKFLSVVSAILLSFMVLLPFNVQADSINGQAVGKSVSQVNLKNNLRDTVITAKNDTIYQNSSNNIASGTSIVSKHKNSLSIGIKETVGTIGWRISNEYVNGKSQFTFHIDSLTGLKPVSLQVSLQVLLRNGVSDNPTPYGSSILSFNASEIEPGANKSLGVDARTAYLTVLGSFVAIEPPDATPNTFVITPATILTNKLNQYFPNYIDPVSKKQAITGVRTDWAVTGTHIWNGRKAYVKAFESQYGSQPDSYWASVEIHHIRPRNFGGDDSYDNLMPVSKIRTLPYLSPHQLLSKWFLNY